VLQSYSFTEPRHACREEWQSMSSFIYIKLLHVPRKLCTITQNSACFC
jgi:hypothetical protein